MNKLKKANTLSQERMKLFRVGHPRVMEYFQVFGRFCGEILSPRSSGDMLNLLRSDKILER